VHLDAAAKYWDRKVSEEPVSWMQPLAVRHYINAQVSGDPGTWPLEWFHDTLGGRTFARVLSIGCGAGGFERSLLSLGIADSVDAFDASVVSVALAASAARAAGFRSRLRLFVANFNEPALPRNTYDLVCFHHSLHHVAKLEKLLKAVLRALKQGGVLYLEEPIGPSRHEWSEKRLEPYDRLYQHFGEDERWFDYIPFPIEWNDESEAVRSSEIPSQLRVGFRIRHFRGYGGNVLAVLFPALLPQSITPAAIEWLIAKDREATGRSERHFHAVIVAEPRQGLSRKLAELRYYFAPKVRFVLRRIAQHLMPSRSIIRRPRCLLHPERLLSQATQPLSGNM